MSDFDKYMLKLAENEVECPWNAGRMSRTFLK